MFVLMILIITAIVTGIAIFCMLLTYYMWIKAVKTGTIFWSTLAALAYFYMVGISKKSQLLITGISLPMEHLSC